MVSNPLYLPRHDTTRSAATFVIHRHRPRNGSCGRTSANTSTLGKVTALEIWRSTFTYAPLQTSRIQKHVHQVLIFYDCLHIGLPQSHEATTNLPAIRPHDIHDMPLLENSTPQLPLRRGPSSSQRRWFSHPCTEYQMHR